MIDVVGARVEVVKAVPTSEADIAAVHTKAHLDHVRRRGLYSIAGLAAGGAVQAAPLGLEAPAFGLAPPWPSCPIRYFTGFPLR